jgi:cytochrome c oxidase subunit 3
VAISLILLAGIMAALLGWILKQTFNTQPWVAGDVSESLTEAPMGASGKVVALVTLLAVVTSFFGLLMSAYSLRMELGDWYPLTEPQELWINTGILALASLAFHWTRNAANKGQTSKLKPGLLLTGLLTGGFLAGQFLVWQQLNASGQFITTNPANAFFFLLTGMHALHILGGMYVWLRATIRVFGGSDADSVKESVELCTVYWHYLLIVWFVLFGLLLAT